jgi:hypothetical protein
MAPARWRIYFRREYRRTPRYYQIHVWQTAQRDNFTWLAAHFSTTVVTSFSPRPFRLGLTSVLRLERFIAPATFLCAYLIYRHLRGGQDQLTLKEFTRIIEVADSIEMWRHTWLIVLLEP